MVVGSRRVAACVIKCCEHNCRASARDLRNDGHSSPSKLRGQSWTRRATSRARLPRSTVQFVAPATVSSVPRILVIASELGVRVDGGRSGAPIAHLPRLDHHWCVLQPSSLPTKHPLIGFSASRIMSTISITHQNVVCDYQNTDSISLTLVRFDICTAEPDSRLPSRVLEAGTRPIQIARSWRDGRLETKYVSSSKDDCLSCFQTPALWSTKLRKLGRRMPLLGHSGWLPTASQCLVTFSLFVTNRPHRIGVDSKGAVSDPICPTPSH